MVFWSVLVYRRELTYGLLNGMRRTYWIVAHDARQRDAYKKSASRSTTESTRSADVGFASRHVGDSAKEEQERLVGWMVQILLEDIKKIVSSLLAFVVSFSVEKLLTSHWILQIHTRGPSAGKQKKTTPSYFPPNGRTCIQEVQEVIMMPKFDASIRAPKGDALQLVQVDGVVVRELEEYVTAIASMYKQNAFHNFNHACRKYQCHWLFV
jgi:hypothetical protein